MSIDEKFYNETKMKNNKKDKKKNSFCQNRIRLEYVVSLAEIYWSSSHRPTNIDIVIYNVDTLSAQE